MIDPHTKTQPASAGIRKKKVLIIASISLLLTALPASYRGYLSWKQHQLHLLNLSAQEYLDNGQWDQAYIALGKAYAEAPTDPTVLRNIAHLTQQTNPDPSRALFFWRQLVACSTPTTADLAAMGTSLMLNSQPDEALKILNSFSPEQRSTKESMELEAQLLDFQGKTVEANVLRRKYLTANLNVPENRLKLAVLDLNSPFAEVQKQALTSLWDIARSEKKSLSAAAIQTLAPIPSLTLGESSALLTLASQHDGIPAGKYYEILHHHLILNPAKRSEAYEIESHKYRNKSIEECAIFYRWLLREKEYRKVLELVPKEKATRTSVLFPIYVEALAGAEQWAELTEVFRKTPSLPLNEIDQAVLQARLAHGKKEGEGIVSGHLKEACRRALLGKNIEALQRIITIAEELGFYDVAMDALIKASAMPQHQVEMLEHLLRLYSRQGDAESMLTTVQKILEARPMTKAHLENSLYLRLLLGKEFESISHNVSNLVTQGYISKEAASFFNSFAAYRFHDTQRLKDLLSLVAPEKLPAGQRAVYAGMLASCGEQARAFAIAEKIAPVLLLENELAFLRKSL